MKRPKTPELKVPQVFHDLLYDLKDRRLLPLVAVILVAIVAVPFIFSGSSSTTPPPKPLAAISSGPKAGKLTVVRTDPGLRNPRKRLGYLAAKDPFKQHYTSPVLKPGSAPTEQTTTTSTGTGGATNAESTTESNTNAGSESPASPGHAESKTENPSQSGGGSGSQIRVFTFAINLKIVRTETDASGKPSSTTSTREKVMAPATLPGEKTQVASYIGISPKTKNPLFLVSSEVSSVFGEAKCVSGTGSCQLVELEPGFPVTFVFGPNSVRYKFNVLKVIPVAAGHL
jgi:hypothetical protein